MLYEKCKAVDGLFAVLLNEIAPHNDRSVGSYLYSSHTRDGTLHGMVLISNLTLTMNY
jgi:hypothetical protein